MIRIQGATAVAGICLLTLTACGGSRRGADWPLPNLDLASTRALGASGIDRGNVGSLHVAWRFRFPVAPGVSGAFTATPVVANGVVYVQDMRSNVYALNLKTGHMLWRRLLNATSPGPNGLAVSGGRVYGATDASAFALDATTGRFVWRRFLVTPTARYIDIAPQVANGLVYVSTIGLPPNGRGILFALDVNTGSIRWRLSTIKDNWNVPKRGRRRRRVGDAECRRRRRLLGNDESVSVRRQSRPSEWRRPRGRESLHGFAARRSTRTPASSSGTTR